MLDLCDWAMSKKTYFFSFLEVFLIQFDYFIHIFSTLVLYSWFCGMNFDFFYSSLVFLIAGDSNQTMTILHPRASCHTHERDFQRYDIWGTMFFVIWCFCFLFIFHHKIYEIAQLCQDSLRRLVLKPYIRASNFKRTLTHFH